MEKQVLLCIGIYLSCSSEVWANSPICSEQPHTFSPFEDNRFGTDGLIFWDTTWKAVPMDLQKFLWPFKSVTLLSIILSQAFLCDTISLPLWLVEQCCQLTHWVCVLKLLPPILWPTVSGCVNTPSLYIKGNWGSEWQRNCSRITQLVIARINTNF